MPSAFNGSASPIPECISAIGELIAPQDRITSAPASKSSVRRSLVSLTPTARSPSSRTFCSAAPVTIVRFGRARAGSRKARAVLHR